MTGDAEAVAGEWFAALRDRICGAFEAIEDAASGPLSDRPPGRFTRREWQRSGGGGGVMATMRGRVFEKVGVNLSTVWGEFQEGFRAEIPGAAEDPRFWASGISVVAHMQSPFVPAVHMNTRRVRTTRGWFGGGADLTPTYPDEAAKQAFHASLKKACDRHDPAYYDKFSEWCDEYFFIRHRGEPRGVGGVFFDYLDDQPDDGAVPAFAFIRDIGEAFLAVYPEIIAERMDRVWTEEERKHQLVCRGRYVEFNLLYDRGTRFGLMTGGNPEAVLMSLPPEVHWP